MRQRLTPPPTCPSGLRGKNEGVGEKHGMERGKPGFQAELGRCSWHMSGTGHTGEDGMTQV